MELLSVEDAQTEILRWLESLGHRVDYGPTPLVVVGTKSSILNAVGVWVKKTIVLREKVEMQSGRCFYCARAMTPLSDRRQEYDNLSPTMDHRIPLGRGGRHEVSNVVAACQRCNNSKGMMAEDEFRAVLEGRASKIRVPDRIRWERRAARRNRVPVAILEASILRADA